MSYKGDTRMMDMYTNNRTKCKCGHSVFIPHYDEKIMCTWCNKWVYRDKQAEFKDKMRSELNRRKLNDKTSKTDVL